MKMSLFVEQMCVAVGVVLVVVFFLLLFSEMVAIWVDFVFIYEPARLWFIYHNMINLLSKIPAC